MTTKKQYEWLLEGIDCANCAAKVEHAVGKIEGVSASNVNFMTKTLQFELDQPTEQQLNRVKETIHQVEPDVTTLDKKTGQPIGQNIDDHHDHDHHHDHHGHSHGDSNVSRSIIRLVVTLIILVVAVLAPLASTASLILFILAYLVAGYDVIWTAIRNLFNGRIFDENFLMTVATLSAFYIREFPEAVSVMLFYQIGELFQDIAVDRSRRSIADLMAIRPDYANLKQADGSSQRVNPEDVQVGDIIVIHPGEKVALDGLVQSGQTSVDTAALTGESMPRTVAAGEEVLSGFVNLTGVVEVAVTKQFSDSTVVKILDLVENASSRKAPTETFISKFARVYTPVVVAIAVLLAVLPPLLMGASFNEWLYRASIFLVISCPCALVVSIPVGFFGGIGSASRKGILVKGSNFLEALNDVAYVVMDKTGTLTKGKFEVTAIHPTEGWTKEQLLEQAAQAEYYSNHPIAKSVQVAYGQTIDPNIIEDYHEEAGYGITVKIAGQSVLVGNRQLMADHHIAVSDHSASGTMIYVAVDGQYAGVIVIGDQIKDDAKATVQQLKAAGVRQITMLTGDSKTVADQVGQALGIDEVYAELLPQDKVAQIEAIMERKTAKEKVVFVGDGINDTPVLARADIGIAMGGLGSDAAIEAADIVIMDDQPSKVATAIQVAKDTRKIVWQNIIFAMAVKGLFLMLGAFGLASMWEAVFADVGVTVLAVLNAMRMMKK